MPVWHQRARDGVKHDVMRRTMVFGGVAACAGAALATFALWRSVPDVPPTAPVSTARLARAIAEIERGAVTTPLIETRADGRYRATFLARREGGHVPRVVSDVTGWGEHPDGTFDAAIGTMRPAGVGTWYTAEATVVPGARIEYQIAYSMSDYRLDPWNPRQSPGPRLGGATASEFVTPGYVAPQPFVEPPVTGGTTVESRMWSRALEAQWRVVTHVPPGIRPSDPVPVLVFLDLRVAQVTRTIDWYVAHGRIPSLLTVFVGPTVRSGDIPEPGALRTFLTQELPRWIEFHHRPAWRTGCRAIVGLSFHARDALDAALACEVGKTAVAAACLSPYDRVGLLVPGRRITPADMAAFARRAFPPRTIALLAGRYDLANVATARALRDALTAAGQDVSYREVPEGHSAVTWTHHVGSVLELLFRER